MCQTEHFLRITPEIVVDLHECFCVLVHDQGLLQTKINLFTWLVVVITCLVCLFVH